MFSKIQLYTIVVLIAALSLLTFTTIHLYKKNVSLESQLKAKTIQLANAQEDVKTQQFTATFTNWVNESYLKTEGVIKSENDKLKSDLANGTRRLHVNAICVQSNVTSTGNTGSAEDGLPRFTPSAEQGWLDLNEGIPANAELYGKALETLTYWHDNWSALCGKK